MILEAKRKKVGLLTLIALVLAVLVLVMCWILGVGGSGPEDCRDDHFDFYTYTLNGEEVSCDQA